MWPVYTFVEYSFLIVGTVVALFFGPPPSSGIPYTPAQVVALWCLLIGFGMSIINVIAMLVVKERQSKADNLSE